MPSGRKQVRNKQTRTRIAFALLVSSSTLDSFRIRGWSNHYVKFQKELLEVANHKIHDVEGVGPVRREKFLAAGIKDTDGLLKSTKTPKQRQDLAEKTGISVKWILKFANMADLFRVPGIGSEYSQLLEASGVDTVIELSTRIPKNLHTKVSEVNKEKKNTRQPPSLAEITSWIEEAKKLPRFLEY